MAIRSLPLIAVFACLLWAAPLVAQQEPFISIIEPAEWRGENVTTRGIVVRRRNSIRVEGLAYHPAGITSVEIDGVEAYVVPAPNGQVRFRGIVDVGSGPRNVTMVAHSPAGPVIEDYALSVDQVDRVYEDPRAAFDESGFDGERYAVIIGISEYADERITDLEYADDDARAFYDFLTSPRAGLGGLEPDNIRLLLDEEATLREIRIALTTFLDQVAPEDIVFVYWAGHGAPDPTRATDHYLYAHDTELSAVAATALLANDLSQNVSRQDARDVILITDACHSGAVMQGARGSNDVNQAFLRGLNSGGGGWLTFTASGVDEVSQEHARWGGGHGVFTHHVIQALEGYADEDNDLVVTLDEMVEYVRDRVRDDTRGAQSPQAGTDRWDRDLPVSIVTDEAVAASNLARAESPEGRTPDAAVVELLSPGGAFAQSLIFPGTGQMRTGHPGRGAVVLASAVGAVAFGYFSTTTVEDCRVNPTDGRCPPNELIGTTEEREYLVPSLIAAGGIVLLGAFDAWNGAKAINEDRRRAAAGGTMALTVLPTSTTGALRRGDVPLLEFRFR
jgi:uncharacterized caspase-like protein